MQAAPTRWATPALEARDVSVRRCGRSLVQRASVTVGAGEFLVLLGAPGSGTDTLLALLAGDLAPDAGRVLVDGRAPLHQAGTRSSRTRYARGAPGIALLDEPGGRGRTARASHRRARPRGRAPGARPLPRGGRPRPPRGGHAGVAGAGGGTHDDDRAVRRRTDAELGPARRRARPRPAAPRRRSSRQGMSRGRVRRRRATDGRAVGDGRDRCVHVCVAVSPGRPGVVRADDRRVWPRHDVGGLGGRPRLRGADDGARARPHLPGGTRTRAWTCGSRTSSVVDLLRQVVRLTDLADELELRLEPVGVIPLPLRGCSRASPACRCRPSPR